MTDQTPQTEASLSLLRRPARAWPKGHDEWAETLAIIEAQVRAEALDVEVLRDAINASRETGEVDTYAASIIAGEYRAILAARRVR